MSLKDDAIEITVVVVGFALAVWYIESKYQAAGGVTGLAGSLFSWAGTGLANAGGAVLDAMPSSQVPAAVDTVQATTPPGQTPSVGTINWESMLMGGGE